MTAKAFFSAHLEADKLYTSPGSPRVPIDTVDYDTAGLFNPNLNGFQGINGYVVLTGMITVSFSVDGAFILQSAVTRNGLHILASTFIIIGGDASGAFHDITANIEVYDFSSALSVYQLESVLGLESLFVPPQAIIRGGVKKTFLSGMIF